MFCIKRKRSRKQKVKNTETGWTAKSLVMAEECPRKSTLYSESIFKEEATKSSYMALVVSEILTKNDWKTLDLPKIRKLVTEMAEDKADLFLTEAEKDATVCNTIDLLDRFIFSAASYYPKRLDGRIKVLSDIGNKLVESKFDFIFRDDNDEVVGVKFQKSKLNLSTAGKSPQTRTRDSIMLYSMLSGLRFLYPKEVVRAELWSLSSKDDKSDELVALWKRDDKFAASMSSEDYPSLSIATNNSSFNRSVEDSIIARINAIRKDDMEKCEKCDIFCKFKSFCNRTEGSIAVENKTAKQTKAAGKPKLTPAQEELVSAEKGVFYCNAVPGGGKTTSLALRFCELVKKGYSPKNILCITFTEKGARELKEKVLFFAKQNKIRISNSALHISTINGFAQKVLEDNFRKLGYSKQPDVAEETEVIDIIKELLDERPKIDGFIYKNPLLDLPNAKGVIKEMMALFSEMALLDVEDTWAYDESVSESELLHKHHNEAAKVVDFYLAFLDKCKEKNLITYSDQVKSAYHYVCGHTANFYKKYPYEHVIVDEAQDTSHMAYKLIKKMDENPANVSTMFVGDIMQSIFSFAKASPKDFAEVPKIYKKVTVINIADNFRSDANINEFANALGDTAETITPTKIVSGRAAKNPVEYREMPNTDEKMEFLKDRIKALLEQGVKPYEIAVIGRKKGELEALASVLRKNEISVDVVASERQLDNENIIGIARLGSFLYKEDPDDFLLADYVAASTGGKALDNLSDFRSEIIKSRITILDALEEISDTAENEAAAKKDFFIELCSVFTKKDDYASAFLKGLVEKISDPDRLFCHLNKMIAYDISSSIEKDNARKNSVVLTTVHSAKGLEYEHVFVILDEFAKNNKPVSEIEEDLRCFYVACTRAKETLTIVCEELHHGKNGRALVSTTFRDMVKKILNTPKTRAC